MIERILPVFEIVDTEMSAIDVEQSEEIAALGYDGTRLLVQFHRLPGIYATPATREQYERLLRAERISTEYSPMVAEVSPLALFWHRLCLYVRRKRK